MSSTSKGASLSLPQPLLAGACRCFWGEPVLKVSSSSSESESSSTVRLAAGPLHEHRQSVSWLLVPHRAPRLCQDVTAVLKLAVDGCSMLGMPLHLQEHRCPPL